MSASILWLSWTPWFSPWGKHHSGKHCKVDTYKTTLSKTLELLNKTGWNVIKIRPRYFRWATFITNWKLTREWLSWNIEIIAIRK